MTLIHSFDHPFPLLLLRLPLFLVPVKRGKISAASGDQKPNGSDQHNTFLVLKLENVKSQTLPLKGVDPVWDEDFLL